MFASLLRSKKRSPRASETTPLLAAIHKYRNRHNDEASEADDDYEDDLGQFDGEIYDEDHDRRRDGPLLPVFSSEFLGGLEGVACEHCLLALTGSFRPHSHIQQHPRHTHSRRPALRNHP